MSMPNTECKVLVLTVGTGNADNLEETLYAPLIKSINTGGPWDRIILLPSQRTVREANEIKNRIAQLSVEIHPIPCEGKENDADASFAHFDSVLGKIIESDGVSPRDITLDFTRGTKAMSAALVLAGVARSIPLLRYIEGKRGKRGSVVAGSEIVKEVPTEVAKARQQINLAEHLMIQGNFEAVCTMHSEISLTLGKLPGQVRGRLDAYGYVAKIYAAWDRFDYRRAYELLSQHLKIVYAAGKFKPTRAMEEWIGKLAKLPNQDSVEERAVYLRYLACDLLANAERRYRDGLFEDAGVRWYRLLELIGQARLFDYGLDSAKLPENDDRVKKFAECHAKNSKPLGKRKDLFTSDRYQTAKFLRYLEDDLAEKLIKENNQKYVKTRNKGLLIHGFDAKASDLKEEDIRSMIENFEQLLYEDRREACGWLVIARSLNFSTSPKDA